MSFTAYAQLRLPQVAEAFTHLAVFPAYFRVSSRGPSFSASVLLLAPVAGAAQGVGLRRLRHQPRLGAHRSRSGGRWPGGVGDLGGGHSSHKRACSGPPDTHSSVPNCYRTRRDFHLRRLQVTLSAAKLGARVGAVHEKARPGGICLCIHRREDQGTWGLAREDARESARNHTRGRP